MKKNRTVSEENIQRELDRVTESELLSEKNQKLLIYLVRKSLENDPPKEATIAIEHFNANLFKEEDTSFVRVAVYHLRKRLKEYYLTDGKNDDVRLDLEKGSYEVTFRENLQSDPTIPKHSGRLVFGLAIIVAMLFLALSYVIISDDRQETYQQILLYEDLKSNTKPVLVVLGDLFMYNDTSGNLVRDYNINSMEDLKIYKPELPIDNQQSRSKYLSRLHAISLYNISSLLNNLSKEVNFRMASEVSIEDIKENNIIFIGYFKSMYLLKAYYKISSYQPENAYSYLISKVSGDTIEITGDPGDLHQDYGIFSRVNGPQDNYIYFIAGFTDTSVEMISSSVMSPGFVEQRISDVGKSEETPRNFEILFEVDGYDRKQLSNIAVVSVNEIEDISRMWE